MPTVSKRRDASRAAPPDDAEAQGLTFEQAVERVEAIIERIEAGEIGLEDSIAQYERGVGLINRCRAILEQAEQRIEELTATGRERSDVPAPGVTRGNTPGANTSDDEPPF